MHHLIKLIAIQTEDNGPVYLIVKNLTHHHWSETMVADMDAVQCILKGARLLCHVYAIADEAEIWNHKDADKVKYMSLTDIALNKLEEVITPHRPASFEQLISYIQLKGLTVVPGTETLQ